ncbi:MAG: murein hydrolase activator EnvC family protein [Cellvibrionaceae bacterium]
MRYSSTFPAIFAFSMALIIFSGLPLSSAVAQGEEEYEKQLKALATNIEKLQKELAKTKTSRDKLQQSLQKSEEEIGSLTKKIDTIKEELAREKKQLAQHQSRRAELEESRKVQQQEVNRIVRQAYQLGRQSQVKLMLNQEEPSKVTRLLRYHDYIIEAHKEKMDVYLATIRDINEVESQITATTERLEASRETLNSRFKELKQSQTTRLATLGELTRSITEKGGSLSKLQGDRERLERLLEEATRSLSNLKLPSDAKPFRSAKGRLPYPAKGRVANSFGSYRLDGKLRWNGIFIKGKTGSKVVSVHHGRVIFSDYLRGHGLLLIVDHGNGYMSLYAHNQTLLKETGDWVSSNEAIAMLGNTGGQSQAGLYFEIRHNGKPQNPSPWLDLNSRG